jgi:hypothetical protein
LEVLVFLGEVQAPCGLAGAAPSPATRLRESRILDQIGARRRGTPRPAVSCGAWCAMPLLWATRGCRRQKQSADPLVPCLPKIDDSPASGLPVRVLLPFQRARSGLHPPGERAALPSMQLPVIHWCELASSCSFSLCCCRFWWWCRPDVLPAALEGLKGFERTGAGCRGLLSDLFAVLADVDCIRPDVAMAQALMSDATISNALNKTTLRLSVSWM